MSDTVMKDEVPAAAVAEVQSPKTEDSPAVAAENIKSEAAVEAPVEAAVDAAVEVKQEEEASTAATEADSAKDAESTEETQNGKTETNILKTTAKINYEDPKKNNKFDPSVLPVTDDPDLIRTQAEYYFSDSNLPTDKFMWELTGGPENKPVSLKTVCGFKRMRRFQPYTAVVAAVRESEHLDLEGEEGEETVKRNVAYVLSTPESQKARFAATVYVKGFGDENERTQFEAEAFFKPYGKVKSVKLRRTNEQLFKGSVFVEFASEEEADAFVKLDPAPTFKGHDLKIMKKRDYVNEKNQLIKEGKLEPSVTSKPGFWEGKNKENRGGRGGRGRGQGRGNGRGRDNRSGPRGEGDQDDWKKRRDDDRKNGFRDSRGGRGRGGRGRGGRGYGDRDRGGNHDQKSRDSRDVKMPTIQTSNDKGEVVQNGEATNGKRARDDDSSSAPPTKKVDTKAEPATTAGQ
ncbi:hypothetical protein B0H66DRAFT_239019 [Apodospora peruviana]|uniref:La domain-containing protein n=1 Tax=Apodospora peruviana TaxID=516989 RepID=A0AAE0I536_9PEZI|nr:hypothetical protein B0H66DRAFT_239019 [Apodospora peruviana]